MPLRQHVAVRTILWRANAGQQLIKISCPQVPMFAESIIYNGENLIYNNGGHNDLVKVLASKVDEDGMLRYTIDYSSGELDEVPHEFLRRPDTPDIASIPATIPQLREATPQFKDKDLETILHHPKPLSPAEQEFLDLHYQLFHLPYVIMFCLEKGGFLLKHLLSVKDRPPPCASCLFGTQHSSNWRSR